MVNEGVRRAYLHPDNKLRASVLAIRRSAQKPGQHSGGHHMSIVPRQARVIVAAKGGGSEAKSKFAMLNPSDSIVEGY